MYLTAKLIVIAAALVVLITGTLRKKVENKLFFAFKVCGTLFLMVLLITALQLYNAGFFKRL